jgi:hypothetical protein
MAGLVGKAEIPIYTASKHGVVGLSKAVSHLLITNPCGGSNFFLRTECTTANI